MIGIYKNLDETNGILQKLNNIESGCWINIVAPTDQELLLISNKTRVSIEFLRAALDYEEISRLEIDDNNTLIIIGIPFTEMEDNSLTYDTYPLAIIHTKEEIITVCLKNNKVLKDFIDGKVNSFFTFKKSRFILQILYKISSLYLHYLMQIDKKSLIIQKKLYRSMKNKELINLLSLKNSLVYFSTTLKSNDITLDKMLKLEFITKYEEDTDILEDVIIENKQAIEMANIYSSILSGTMDAFASIISNNLNIVMKFLTSVTLVMSIPTMISGLFGMNVNVPFRAGTPLGDYGFQIVVAITLFFCFLAIFILRKKDML